MARGKILLSLLVVLVVNSTTGFALALPGPGSIPSTANPPTNSSPVTQPTAVIPSQEDSPTADSAESTPTIIANKQAEAAQIRSELTRLADELEVVTEEYLGAKIRLMQSEQEVSKARDELREEQPVGVGSGTHLDEGRAELLQQAELDLPPFGRLGAFGRAREQERDQHGQAEEDEQHEDELAPSDREGAVGREEEEVEHQEREERGEDPGPETSDRCRADHHDEEEEPLAEGCEVGPDRQEGAREREAPADRDQRTDQPRTRLPPEQGADRRAGLAPGCEGGWIRRVHRCSTPSLTARDARDPLPYGTRTSRPRLLTEPLDRRPTVRDAMIDTILLAATVAAFALLFLFVRWMDRI